MLKEPDADCVDSGKGPTLMTQPTPHHAAPAADTAKGSAATTHSLDVREQLASAEARIQELEATLSSLRQELADASQPQPEKPRLADLSWLAMA